MNKQEWQYRMDLVSRELRVLELSSPKCENCEHFSAPNCIKFDAVPPENIKREACDEWKWNEIPF